MPGLKRERVAEASGKDISYKKVKASSEAPNKPAGATKSNVQTQNEMKRKSVAGNGAVKSSRKREASSSEKLSESSSNAGLDTESQPPAKKAKGETDDAGKALKGSTDGVNVTKSREAHAKQKELVRERKAAKPHADEIQQAKKIWERLRIKSKVPKEERAQLIAELFDIVLGRVQDFVFKHDSVRPIQSAIKYGTMEQKRAIARELEGSYQTVLQGKYSRHLVGKLLESDDKEIRDMIIPTFYGSVRRLINHPDASWMLDDIYRVKASKLQKATMLREWYGTEFAITKGKDSHITADLSEILAQNPEKRKPIMDYLYQMINQLIQKKLTGFTMLHDALLQYFLQLEKGTTEFNDCIRLIIGDNKEEEVDLLKNLAFTKSGAELVSLVLAYSDAKDRKLILRAYKDAIELVARDRYGWQVLVAAYEVIDDTRETLSRIFKELVSYEKSPTLKQAVLEQRKSTKVRNNLRKQTEENLTLQEEKILDLSKHLHGRIAMLYPFTGPEKWLLPRQDQQDFIKKIQVLREGTSKKDPQTRRMELVTALSPAFLQVIADNAPKLAMNPFGSQFIAAVLLAAPEDKPAAADTAVDLNAESGDKLAAVEAVASHFQYPPPSADKKVSQAPLPAAMLRALIVGGRYDTKEKKLVVTAPDLNFADTFWKYMKEHVLLWASWSPFVLVALLRSDFFTHKAELKRILKDGRAELKKLANNGVEGAQETKLVGSEKRKGSEGIWLLMEMLQKKE